MAVEVKRFSDEEFLDIPQIPKRPSDTAAVADWVKYCVALGADENYLTETTQHTVDSDSFEEHTPLTRAELKELANNLGG